MARRPFKKYPNKVLVESGTYEGDGVQDALDAGFEQVISFEVSATMHKHSSERFKENKAVEIVHGSSAVYLYDKIKEIKEPITFWLDGHHSFGKTSYDPENYCPLLKEIEQIGKHEIKTHTILIDDRRLLRHNGGAIDGLFNVIESEVVDAIKKINSDYKFKYEDGHIENDIIVAYV